MTNPNTNQTACVVIPVYKQSIDRSEEMALRQITTVLSHHDIYLISHQELDLSVYKNIFPDIKIELFSKKFFTSIHGYSRLCLYPFFYKRFIQYKYMLICQLDAYVFKDDLDHWTARGYDYIGAPWIDTEKKEPKAWIDLSSWFYNKVGNGGFSLRKIVKFYFLSYFLYPISFLTRKNEDFIWCVLLDKIGMGLKKPKVEEALQFAVESKPSKAFEILKGKLPFGCHAWEKNELEFWKKYIKF